MKTELKDVLHLYLGCEIQTSFRTASMMGQPMNKAIGILVDCDLLLPGKIGIQFEWDKATLDTTTLPIDSCKPILRQLSSITDEEQVKWNEISTPIGEMAIESAIQIHWTKRINFYRSIFIDCDGLIESGQAIDKNQTK